MNMSNYLEKKLGDHTLLNTAYTPAATLYLACYTTNPTKADVGTEVDDAAYDRQEITFQEDENGRYSNSNTITFPTATEDQGTITHLGVRDAGTSGNLLLFGALDTPRLILTNDFLKFLPGEIVFDFL